MINSRLTYPHVESLLGKKRINIKGEPMATLSIRVSAKTDAPDCAMSVTTDNFRSWKRKHGRNMAFVVQLPGVDDDDSGVLVCTLSEMCRLPTGQYQARLVRRCEITDASLKQQLRGSDVWKDA